MRLSGCGWASCELSHLAQLKSGDRFTIRCRIEQRITLLWLTSGGIAPASVVVTRSGIGKFLPMLCLSCRTVSLLIPSDCPMARFDMPALASVATVFKIRCPIWDNCLLIPVYLTFANAQ